MPIFNNNKDFLGDFLPRQKLSLLPAPVIRQTAAESLTGKQPPVTSSPSYRGRTSRIFFIFIYEIVFLRQLFSSQGIVPQKTYREVDQFSCSKAAPKKSLWHLTLHSNGRGRG